MSWDGAVLEGDEPGSAAVGSYALDKGPSCLLYNPQAIDMKQWSAIITFRYWAMSEEGLKGWRADTRTAILRECNPRQQPPFALHVILSSASCHAVCKINELLIVNGSVSVRELSPMLQSRCKSAKDLQVGILLPGPTLLRLSLPPQTHSGTKHTNTFFELSELENI